MTVSVAAGSLMLKFLSLTSVASAGREELPRLMTASIFFSSGAAAGSTALGALRTGGLEMAILLRDVAEQEIKFGDCFLIYGRILENG